MHKVLVVNRLEDKALSRLQSKADTTVFMGDATFDNPAFTEALKQAEGITGLALTIDDELLQHAPHLKIVSNVSVGYNNLDLDLMTKKNVMGTNTPGVLSDTVADLGFALLMASARRLPELDYYVKSGKWNNDLTADYYGIDIHHKTIGIIGMGNIGQAVAKRAHFGFDMDVIYHSRSRKPEAEKKLDATYASIDELMKRSDFVVLMTPLTQETAGFITKREFSLMKESAIFINMSRGQTIIEQDLIDVLQAGKIRGAGLDVFETEPIEIDNPLLEMPNVVTLPHIGSSTYQTELAMSELAVDNLLAGLNREKPVNLLNEEVWHQKE